MAANIPPVRPRVPRAACSNELYALMERCWEEAPIEIVKLLIKHPSMIDAYTAALSNCKSFEEGIVLAQALEGIEAMTIAQADAMVKVFNQSPDIHGCWAFNGTYPNRYGDGLAPLLSRLTGKKYLRTESNRIERKAK